MRLKVGNSWTQESLYSCTHTHNKQSVGEEQLKQFFPQLTSPSINCSVYITIKAGFHILATRMFHGFLQTQVKHILT